LLDFDRSTVKHALQNAQSDCHQCLPGSFRVHQIRFRPGLRPGPRWGAGILNQLPIGLVPEVWPLKPEALLLREGRGIKGKAGEGDGRK